MSQTQAIEMPPYAVMMIANGIYGNLREFRRRAHKTPPLCIVMTKADVVNNATAQAVVRNPFDEIKVMKGYLYRAQFDNLSMTYQTFGEDKIREPLDWCCMTYSQMKNKTYLSMMACSATGRVGDVWDGKDTVIPMNPKGPFVSNGIRDLVHWVFQTAGLSSVMNNYQYPGVPSNDEIYLKASGEEKYRADHFTDKGAGERCTYIPCVFMNPTQKDGNIFKASQQQGRTASTTLRVLREEGVLIE